VFDRKIILFKYQWHWLKVFMCFYYYIYSIIQAPWLLFMLDCHTVQQKPKLIFSVGKLYLN
jgi:hypothetical protein